MRKFCLVCLSLLLIGKIFSQCPPHVQVTMPLPTFTLTCNNPTLLAIGSSTTSDTEISWIVPSTPSLINSSTIILGSPNGPPTSTSSLTYANYTVVATNTLLSCSSTSIVQVFQNFKPPKCTIEISIGTPTTICNNSPPVLTTGSYTYQDGGPQITFYPCWSGPSPQTSTCGAAAYTCYVPGIYSLTLTSSFNGCSGSDTIEVKDTRPQFGLQGTAPTSSANCNGSVIVTTQIPNGYSLSATSGSLSGTTINNLCYGWVKVCMTFTDTQCFKCDSILMNAATSLNEIDFDNEISIYPNPTSSSFFIKNNSNKNVSVKIFDLEGRIMEAELVEAGVESNVASSPDNLSGSATVKEAGIEIKNLKPGIYFIEINLEGIFVRKKIVITK